MIYLSQQVQNELDIIRKGRVYQIPEEEDSRGWKIVQKLIDKLDDGSSYILLLGHEIPKETIFNKTYQIIERNFTKYGLISTASAESFRLSTHPITNLIMWRNLVSRSKVSWDSKPIEYFPKKTYKDKPINFENRKHRGILSVRKSNPIREYLFSNNPKIKDGITRFVKIPHFKNQETDADRLKDSEFPTIHELQEEYKQSYFSFVIESERGPHSYSQITEKTIMAILTGTMPVILGSKNLISNLEKMGIKTWNNPFGFSVADCYSNYSTEKCDSYLKVIEKINSLTFDEVKFIYEKDKKFIEWNYNLVSKILFSDEFNDCKLPI
jgi:hypothetical protein